MDKPKLTRVCQIVSTLHEPKNGLDAAEDTVRHIVDWLAIRTGFYFNDNQKIGNTAINVSKADCNIESLKLGDNASSLWSLQYKHPDSQFSERTWITEIAVGKHETSRAVLGLRLNYRDNEEISRIPLPSVPRVLNAIANSSGIIMDGRLLDSSPHYIGKEGGLHEYALLAGDKKRKLPIILISPHRQDGYLLDPEITAERMLGIAHVFALEKGNSYLLQDTPLPNAFVAFNGGIRIIRPGIDLDDPDPSVNPLLIHKNYATRLNSLRTLVSRIVFSINLENETPKKEFPSFTTIRRHYYEALKTENVEKKASSSAVKQVEEIINAPEIIQSAQNETPVAPVVDNDLQERQAQINALNLQIAHLTIERDNGKEELENLLALIDEDAIRTKDIKEENLRLKQENFGLIKEVENMNSRLQEVSKPGIIRKLSPFPSSLEGISEWAEEHYSDRLIITKRASDSAHESVYRDPDLAYRCLILLAREKRDSYVISSGGNNTAMRAFDEAAKKLTVTDRFSISKAQAPQYGDEYYALHEGEKHFLDRHLAKGASRDPRNCLRIYYTYEEEARKILVGHMTDHLTNSMT